MFVFGRGMKIISWTLLHVVIVMGQENFQIETRIMNDTSEQTFQLNYHQQYVLIYNDLETMNPYRVKTSSPQAVKDKPVLVVARQEKQVTAWSMPLVLESSLKQNEFSFTKASKTLCHDYMEDIVWADSPFSIAPLHLAQNFIISLSTSNTQTVNVTVELEEEKYFFVELDKNYSLSVSPSESRYVFYKFDKNTSDTIVIEVDSQDEKCLTISVQDSKCPVLDTNKDIKYEGTYQTINTKGAITLARRRFVGGFFLVFVAKPDNYDCSQDSSYLPRLTRIVSYLQMDSSNITFVVRNGIAAENYLTAIMATLTVLFLVGVLVLTTALVFHRYGTISKNKYNDVIVTDYFEPMSEQQIYKILVTDHLTLSEFARHPARIKKRSYNYLWHTLSIAIFYSIPVVQLVVTYQRIINRTGDQDMCYYNFLCAHPLGGFTDFNHIYSNIGYVVFGILFICAVFDRHRIIKIRKEKGIPVHYGLFHAMGVALIIEGLLSACYHICPSQSNYQFDTSFMYVMAVLCMVKLYQNRHSDINATAYTTFTVLGVAIFLAMIGILNGNLAIWVIFVVCYTLLVVGLSFKIYFLNYVIDGLEQFKNCINDHGFCFESLKPIRKTRFVLLLIANIANYSMLIIGLWLYNENVTDFGTFLLALLMGNGVIHAIFYTCMKLINKERVCFEAICYGLLSIATWSWSSIYFLDAATLWTVTPAESRQWNQECLLLKFFDKHDVWHLLSAPALYFTFMYLMSLDDDIMDKEQTEIPVF